MQSTSFFSGNRQFLETLRAMGKEVYDAVPDINFGGCCVYAAKVAETLQAMGIEVHVVTAAPWEEDSNRKPQNNHVIYDPTEAEDELPINFHHVGIRFKLGNRWYVHDTNFTRPGKFALLGEDALDISKVWFTPYQAKKFAEHKSFWNKCFDRSEIPTVHEIVDEFLGIYQQALDKAA